MKKWQIIFAALSGLLMLISASAFSLKQIKNKKLQGTFAQVENDEVVQFMTADEAQVFLRKNHPQLLEKEREEININLLEESLEKHPAVENAEVYSTIKGNLYVKITQRVPVLRFNSSLSSYYLDKNAHKMPLSSAFTASVPLVTGGLRGQEKEACQLFAHLHSDPICQNWFTGLHIQNPKNWTLYAKVGAEQVHLGSPENFDKKLAKLKIFYRKALTNKERATLESINLKYQDQVICKRHPKK